MSYDYLTPTEPTDKNEDGLKYVDKDTLRKTIATLKAEVEWQKERNQNNLLMWTHINKGYKTVLEMVVDNRKMPHQHTDPQLRLYCLSERAQEVLDDTSTSTS